MPNFDDLEQHAQKIAGEHGEVVNKEVDEAAKRAEGALGTNQGQPQAGEPQQAAPQPDPSQAPPQQ